MIFLYLLLFNFVIGLPYEVCEKFPLDFNLYDCTYSPVRRELEWIPPMKECPNLGTWDCATFKCFWPNETGFCRHGEIDYGDCCTFKEIHYVEMWFEPNENCGVDWELDIFNLEIKGIGDNICIENGDSTCFEDVFSNMGKKTHIGVILEYNETCITNIIIVKNGSRILNVTGHDLDLFIDVFFTTIIRSMVEIDNEGYNEKVYRISAHTIVLTEEQILELYNLGSDRSPETEICSYLTLDELDECHNTRVPLFWMIIAIVLMGILAVMLIAFFIWLLYRLFTINRKRVGLPTNNNSIGKDVFF